MTDETRLYSCGGIPVELTLPQEEHKFKFIRPIEYPILLCDALWLWLDSMTYLLNRPDPVLFDDMSIADLQYLKEVLNARDNLEKKGKK